MNIIVFGATGQTGRHAVEQLLAEGHNVTYVVRRPDQLALRHDGLRIVKGDVFDSGTFHPVMEGKEGGFRYIFLPESVVRFWLILCSK